MFKPIASRLAISQKTKRRRRPLSISSAALRAVDENGAPRAAIVALTIDVPPTKRPRGTRKLRPPSVPAPSVLAKSQSNSGIPLRRANGARR